MRKMLVDHECTNPFKCGWSGVTNGELLKLAENDFEPVAAYAVKTYGDGNQLEALGALPAAEIVAIYRATAKQARTAAA